MQCLHGVGNDDYGRDVSDKPDQACRYGYWNT